MLNYPENPRRDLKSDNLQYDMLGRWVDGLIDQASDSPSIILKIENKNWVAGLELGHWKLFIFILVKL